MATQEIPLVGYQSKLLNRVDVAEGTMAFHFEKPPGFDFKPGQSVDLTLPSSAIDLPLKILLWEDVHEKVWITYNSPIYLQKRHNIPPELLQNIAVIEPLAKKAAE